MKRRKFADNLRYLDDHIIWTGKTNIKGHPVFWDGHRQQRANRYLWKQIAGELSDDIYLVNNCDVQDCIAPDHQLQMTPEEAGSLRGTAVPLPMFRLKDREWMKQGLCQGIDSRTGKRYDPKIWVEPTDAERAVSICMVCPVKDICNKYASENEMVAGIWGGNSYFKAGQTR